jgi:hypothetical protein
MPRAVGLFGMTLLSPTENASRHVISLIRDMQFHYRPENQLDCLQHRNPPERKAR